MLPKCINVIELFELNNTEYKIVNQKVLKGMVAHDCSPTTQEAEAGGLLQVS